MALTAEEAYLEELWREEDEQSEEATAMQQMLAQQHEQQHDALPSYQELMGQGSPAVTLRRRAKAEAAANGTSSPGNPSPARGPGGRLPSLAMGPTVGANVEQLKRRLQTVVAAVEGHQQRYDTVLLEANKAADLVHSMEAEIGSLEAEAEELARRVPPAAERQRQVATWLAQRSAALEAQRQVLGGKQLELIEAEAALRAAETELDFMAEARNEIAEAQAAETAALSAAAATLRAKEDKAVEGYRRKQAAEAARLADVAASAEDLAQRRIQVAEEAQAKAMERLKANTDRIREGIASGRDLLGAEQSRRREAVLGLKESLAAVQADVAQQAELARVLQRQRRDLQEKEFGALVEAGLNPYEVFRRRDQEAAAARQHEAITGNIATRQLEVAAQLAREQEAYAQKLAARKREKKTREIFDREMGPAARQARTEAYMQAHTVGGVSMLDPTGRVQPFPSEAVVVKTRRFGGGGAPEAVVQQQLQRLGDDTKPKQLLLPAKYRNAADTDAAAVAGLGRGGGSDDEEGMGSPPRSPTLTQQLAATQQSLSATASLAQQQQQAAGDRYKQLATRALTKHEQGLMEAAKTRHKGGIGVPQTQMGRTFGGDAFLPSPGVVEFKDFDVGRTVSSSVQIINRSYKKNTFRVTGIPVEYCDVLDFSYKLPGYLAPGVSAEVVISFTPKAPVDIDTSLQLLADTGPFEVPIRCRTKRAALSVAPSEVDFGAGVTLGESATRTFTIANDGALEVEFRLDSPQLSEDERALLKSTANMAHLMASATVAAAAAAAAATSSGQGPRSARSFANMGVADAAAPETDTGMMVAPREERRLSHGGFTVFPCVGVLKGYSKVNFTVTFAPVVAAPARLLLHASYKAPAMKRLALPHHEVALAGTGRDVPVYVERPLIDFQCCMLGHLYRDVLVVRNGGKSAMKVMVVPRPELEGFFEFSPDFGFVQAGDSFPITIRFKPTPALLHACRKHVVEPAEEQILEIGMRLSVPDQSLPVPFTLRAQITNTDLLFQPPALDFGECVMGERTAVKLLVRNPGRLPQTFGFVGLPSGLHFTPNDGFGYVLPGEALERLVSFQPPIAGPQTFSITAKTLAGRSFTLPCRANGVAPPVVLSSNRVRMPATPVGDTRTVSVVLINKTDQPQSYEFAVPADSDLTLSPHVGLVPPQSRLRVQIDYSPRPPVDGEQQGALPPQSAPNTARGPRDGGGRLSNGNGGGYEHYNDDGEPEDEEQHTDGDSFQSPSARASPVPPLGRGGRGSAAGEEEGEEEDMPVRSKSSTSSQPGGGRRASSPQMGRKGLAMGRIVEDDADDDADDDDAAGAAAAEAEQRKALAALKRIQSMGGGEPGWYRWREHAITCYIKPQPSSQSQAPTPSQSQSGQAPAASPAADPAAAAAESAPVSGPPPQEIHLQVATCAVLPDLVLQAPPDLPYVPLHQCHCLDFGPVPVGQRVVRRLELANEGEEPLVLGAESLDSREVFGLVNALRPVRPGASFRVMVSFTPQARTEYLEVLVLKSARTRLRLALKGAGIAPELQLGPEGVTATGLDLGDVLVGEAAARTLTVTNVCPFPLSFTMRLAGRPSAADPNPAMRQAFSCHPAEGTLAQGESCEVAVSFTPFSQRPYFEDVLQVVVPNQQDQLLVPLRGRGWREAVFVAGPDYPEPQPDPFLLHELAKQAGVPLPPSVSGGAAAGAAATAAGDKPSTPAPGKPPATPPGGASKSKAAAAAATAAAASAGGAHEPRELTLNFPHAIYPGEVATAAFDVGSLKSTVSGSAPGEVGVAELPAEAREAGWAVADPPAAGAGGGGKVPLAAGERKPITLSYSAPAAPHPGMVVSYGHAEHRVLRLQLTLKGGLAALSGGPEGRKVVVAARCRLLPGARPPGEPTPPGVTPAPVAAAVSGAGAGAAGAKKLVPPPSPPKKAV